MRYLPFPIVLIAILSFPLSIFAQLIPGESYFSSDNYVEYIAGNLPLIISVPHGGELKPQSIPDRDCSGCVYVKDSYTQELGREIAAAIQLQTGCYPHVVINLLHREKLDANRAIGEAADSNPEAEAAWTSYHAFIDSSENQIMQAFGKGLFLDLHGHGHDIQRIELGYLLSGSELRRPNSSLNDSLYINDISIRNLILADGQSNSLSQLVRGTQSLGALLEDRNYPSVPSDLDPAPQNGESYFSGGYNTRRYGSQQGGSIDAIQAECNQDIRFQEDDRQQFADSMGRVMIDFLQLYYLDQGGLDFCNAVSMEESIDFLWELYPNPARDHLLIETDLIQYELAIINQLGQLISQASMNSNQNRLDISSLNCGNYIIEVSQEKEVLHRAKFIKSCE
ncbi:MAG: T9SS type A sorting domain-containing protein [Bacteroidia bacterium]|nr:T9SS type A sorting domain-containing protein [Bacteroidia bacterium]